MPWWVIVYIIINLAISVYCTALFKSEGYYTNWSTGKTKWGMAILIFVVLLLAGLPIAIFGGIILLFEG